MRLRREAVTIEVMIGMYCAGKGHARKALCESCADLRDYALLRVENCAFGSGKPVCAKCPTHCYKSGMRDRVREVMRYSGPRMILRHPALAIMHLFDSARSRP